MPDQPTQEAQVNATVQPNVELPANATPQAFGADVGQADETAGEVSTKLHFDAVNHANQTVALDNYNKLAEWENQNLYDPKTGVLNQRLGADAPGAVEQTLASRQRLVDQIGGGLANDQQKEQFQRLAQEHGTQVTRQLYGYESKELREHQAKTSDAFIANTMSAIAHAPNDEIGTMEKIGRIRATAKMTAESNGDSPEEVKASVDAVTSDAHMTVVRSLVDADQGSDARSYFEENKDEIGPQGLAQAHSMLKISAVKDESRAISDSITRRDGQPDGVPDLGADLAELEKRNITDTEVYDQAKQRIKQNWADLHAAHNDSQQKLSQDIQDALEDPANTKHDIPPTLLASADRHTYKAALLTQKQMRQGDIPKTDPEVYADIQTQFSNPEKWKELVGDDSHKGSFDPIAYKPYLSPPAYLRLVDEVKATRQKVINKDNTLSQGQVATSVTEDLFKANNLTVVGKPGSTKQQESAALQGRFLDQLHRAVGAAAVEKGSNLTRDEIETEAKKLLTQTTWQKPMAWWDYKLAHAPGTAFGTDTATGRAFEQPGADTFAYSIRDIPKDWRDKFDASDARTGVKRTDKERLDYYNANRPGQAGK